MGLGWKKRFIKLFQYLVLVVFLGAESKYVVEIAIFLFLEADARVWYPLNRVLHHKTFLPKKTVAL